MTTERIVWHSLLNVSYASTYIFKSNRLNYTFPFLILLTIPRPQLRVGGAKGQNTANLMQRWSTSSNNSDGTGAMAIAADQQSFSSYKINTFNTGTAMTECKTHEYKPCEWIPVCILRQSTQLFCRREWILLRMIVASESSPLRCRLRRTSRRVDCWNYTRTRYEVETKPQIKLISESCTAFLYLITLVACCPYFLLKFDCLFIHILIK